MNIYIHHLFDQLATLCQMCFIYCSLSCFFFFLKKFYGGIVPARLVGPYFPSQGLNLCPLPSHGIIMPNKINNSWEFPGGSVVRGLP